jgi:serine/threonine-protein kinase HipA
MPSRSAWPTETARPRLETFGDRRAIVVDGAAGGSRLPEEDFTQALALASKSKNEGHFGAAVRVECCWATRPHTRDDDAFREDLLPAVPLDLVIDNGNGDGDAHSKNNNAGHTVSGSSG